MVVPKLEIVSPISPTVHHNIGAVGEVWRRLEKIGDVWSGFLRKVVGSHDIFKFQVNPSRELILA
jgi:hypothetical protein